MSKENTVFFLFCGRCGEHKKGSRPKLTLRVKYLRIDPEGTIFINCICSACLAPIEIPWTIEENLKAMEEAKFSDIDQFRDELDDGSFWEELGDGP